MRFEGKSVVVTGASSGMGYKIALDYAAEGATVIAVARRKDRLEQLAAEAKELPGKILIYTGDISSKEVNEGMIDFAIENCGKNTAAGITCTALPGPSPSSARLTAPGGTFRCS